jgi:ribonuclease Z
MQLNEREKPLHLYGPRGMEKLTSQLLSLGYFRPSYEIIVHELNNNETVEFDEYLIHVLQVNHNVPAFSYCLEERQRPGKFNKTKALKLGIPEGPQFSKLQHGQTITLANGKKITPEMVLGSPRKGRKIVISGDTTPCEEMIRFSKDADVLIHEATFDSELKEIAQDYGHTTAFQAAEIAKKAQVEKLYLVHISPRYLDHHVLENDARNVFKNSFVPKDFQEVEITLKK